MGDLPHRWSPKVLRPWRIDLGMNASGLPESAIWNQTPDLYQLNKKSILGGQSAPFSGEISPWLVGCLSPNLGQHSPNPNGLLNAPKNGGGWSILTNWDDPPSITHLCQAKNRTWCSVGSGLAHCWQNRSWDLLQTAAYNVDDKQKTPGEFEPAANPGFV